MADMRRKFQEIDRDGNGVVTLDEAHELLHRELAFSHSQTQELVKRYDKNGDGQLSYEEFIRFYTKVRAKLVHFQYCYKTTLIWNNLLLNKSQTLDRIFLSRYASH